MWSLAVWSVNLLSLDPPQTACPVSEPMCPSSTLPLSQEDAQPVYLPPMLWPHSLLSWQYLLLELLSCYYAVGIIGNPSGPRPYLVIWGFVPLPYMGMWGAALLRHYDVLRGISTCWTVRVREVVWRSCKWNMLMLCCRTPYLVCCVLGLLIWCVVITKYA